MKRRLHRSGQNLVEFALVLPLLTAFIFGIVEFGWAFYAYSELTSAAREGARYAAVHGELCAQDASCQPATPQTVREYIRSRLSLPDADTIDVELDGSLSPGDRVTVRVSYNFRPLVGFILPSAGLTFHASSSMIVHY